PENAYCGWYRNTHGNPVNEGGICDTGGVVFYACNRITVNAGGECRGYGGCQAVTVNEGGVCRSMGGACGGGNDKETIIEKGGLCIGEGPGNQSCLNITVKAGGRCKGINANDCGAGEFYGTCEGWGVNVCKNSVFYEGANCEGHVLGSCNGIFKAGSTCTAYESGACQGDYSQGGCCVAAGGTCPAGTACQS
ncbi:MAG: hypothetical protein IKO35_02050, partial [Elusimicrobiaceae bacterium]|nr:hypothetical protein [Elusimicrobiaceae bacterium]